MSLDIRIITAPREPPAPEHLVMRLADLWQEDGHRVTVGPAQEVSGDVALLHFDRTCVDDADVPPNPAGVPFLNHRVRDISKRFVSRHLVGRGDGYRGRVIVKTNRNYFGLPEAGRTWRGRVRRALGSALPWRLSRTVPRDSYPILDTPDDVPEWVWRDDGFVVEQFLPEVVDGLYVLRIWTFLGREEYGAALFSYDPIVKAGRMVKHEYFDSVPAFLRGERERLGFDFGKFDYVEQGEEVVLLDANKTPTITRPGGPNLRRLADGLAGFLA